jgi:hypothetical protein
MEKREREGGAWRGARKCCTPQSNGEVGFLLESDSPDGRSGQLYRASNEASTC